MNKPFVLLSRFFAVVVVIAFAASALADVVYVPFVKVDVNGYNNSSGKNPSATLPGYNTMNFVNDTLSSTVTINPDVSVTVDRVSTTKNRDRESSKGDALTNDFIFEQTTNEPITVTLNGLTVGKEYSLKIYSQDITANNGTSGTWNITQGETTEQIGVQTNTTGAASYKSTDVATYLAYTFTASANTAVLTGLATNQFVFLNGIELSEAYDPASGYTYFDVNSNHTQSGSQPRLLSPRATELFVDNSNTSTTATATAPSGIKITVTSDAALNSRTRSKTNSAVDMNLYNDFLFSGTKQPFTVTLDNLSTNAIYRLTVHSVDPDSDQSAGVWTMSNSDGDVLFVKSHTLTFSDASTWAFSQSFKPGTTSVSMSAELNSKVYTMFNGLELQTISQDTADYTWGAGRAAWLADGKWLKKDGTTGTPGVGDICYVTSTDTTAMDTNYWLETTTTPFNGTLVMGTGSRLLMKSNATANDLIFDGGYLHHGEQSKTYALSGNLLVASNTTIDLDDGGARTLQINSVMTGSGNLNILGSGISNSVVELNNVNEANYHGKFILTKTNLKLTGGNACVGTGDLDIPSTSQLTLNGPNAGMHYVSNLTGSGPISVTATSRFDLASSEAQTYSGTISIAANQSLHVGYTISGDKASDVSLPNATISLASGSNLGLIHQSASAIVSSLVIGTLNGVSDSVVRASGNVNANGSNYATLTVGQGVFAGVIGGSNTSHNKMRLVKNTDGTLMLSENNTYIGGTDIQAGKIVLTGAGTLGTGAVTIGENGTLEFNVAEGDPKKMTISSTITSAGKITKTGNGVLQLYTAAEGLVDAASFVVSSGRLDMKEFFKGTLEIGNGAEFSPGNSVGTLNVDGTFKADAFSTLIFEQDASGMDSLSASSFDIDPKAEIQLDITALIPGATYDVIVNTSADGFTTEQGSESFWTNLLADGLPYYLNLSVVDNHIVRMHIDANAVPEPSTWALLVLGVVVLFLRKRS
ncbi:MAG: PEP-CTERM sorting domain-containing protein [Thermoguttaceae bacterium]|nr:PEP-CTERM sorting domain-containing protein [Thermoguttaceae bacterium]